MSVELRSRLLNIMRSELSSLDFQPTSYCEHQFEKIVGQGVQRMRMYKATDNVGKVSQAEASLKRLINYFCEYSRKVGTYPTLSNNSFDSALRSCPPFWPFRV